MAHSAGANPSSFQGLEDVASQDLAQAILETMDHPLLILSGELVVVEANRAFFELFKTNADETCGRPVYELGNGQWDVPALRELLEKIIPERSVVTNYRIEHAFPDIGKRVMILNAKRLQRQGERPQLILLAIADRTELEQARFELEGYREFQEKLIDSVREALLVLDWDLKVVRANQPFYELFQVSPSQCEGRPVYELGNRQWDVPRLRALLEDVLPRKAAFDDVEISHDFERIGPRTMLLNGRMLDHLDLILLAIRDVTEQHRREIERKTVMGELNHRVKNIMSSVQALAMQTFSDSTTLEEFRQSFSERLISLSKIQDLLIRAPEDRVDLMLIIRQELDAIGATEGTNYFIAGPKLMLNPKAAQALAMVIHELTTNAAKYGALAASDGSIHISWTLEGKLPNQRVIFQWQEQGVEIEPKPLRNGYGSKVLSGVVRVSLEGRSEWTLNRDGAAFSADFPVSSANWDD